MVVKQKIDARAAWGRQLLQEYEIINYQYNLKLRVPCLEITESQKMAGSWQPGSRTLKLASWLLLDHDWSVVLLVLKHEMAHQYVSEIEQAENEPPHGMSFQRACDRLGLLDQEFRGSSAHFPQVAKESSSPSSGVQGKIAKLFALAESGNIHEAELALQKGNELLRKYNVERLDSSENSRYNTVIITHRKKRIETYQRSLAAILNDFYFVYIVFSQTFDQHTLENYKSIELTGEMGNLSIAEYVYQFMEKNLAMLWAAYRRESGASAREKNSFYLGVIQGFREKLSANEQRLSSAEKSQTSELIHLKDQALERYYHARYPKIRRLRRQGPRLFRESFESGKEKGAKLVIHKGISRSSESENSKKKSLPPSV